MTTSTPSAGARSTAAYRRTADTRIADYQEAFGLPSALHHHTLPELVSQFGIARLRSLVNGRSRH